MSKNVTVKAIQQSLDFSTFSFIPTGAKWQQIAISDSVVDSSVELVNQDGEIWNCVDSLVYSKSNDRHIISTVNQNGISVIQFGDGVTGALPQSNNNLTGKYYTTLGLRGNLKAFEINKIVSTLNIPNLKCYNINEASGGTFADSVQDIRLNLQRLKRTLGTAVTKEDLILATESIQGVLRSGVKIVDGSPIEIYILPVGGGVASNTLKDFVKQKIDSVRVLGRKVQIKQAGVARLKIGLNVRLSSNFSQVEKRQEITAKLLELFSYNNRKVGESVELSDIFQEVEGINGVSSSDVTEMTITPYIRPINGNNTPLNCSISISRNSATTNNWKIQFQSVTRFSVFRNSEFIGAYNILQNVVLNEISFTITGTYLAGQSWEFYSYKGYGSIQLQEQSIVVLEENNISIAFQ